MFTYIDPTVRERLVEQGKLIRIDAEGQVTDPHSSPEPGARAISILRDPSRCRWSGQGDDTPSTGMQVFAIPNCPRHRNWPITCANEKVSSRSRSSADSMAVNSVLVVGNRTEWENPLVRVHSSCLTGGCFWIRSV